MRGRRPIALRMLRARVRELAVDMAQVPRGTPRDELAAPSALHRPGGHLRRPLSPQPTMHRPVPSIVRGIRRLRLPMLQAEPVAARLRDELLVAPRLRGTSGDCASAGPSSRGTGSPPILIGMLDAALRTDSSNASQTE